MLIDVEEFPGIYLYRPYVDMRKWITGLSILVQSQMKLRVFERSLFVFCNKRKNRLKILYWDKTGFALWFKVLDEEKFRWPSRAHEETIRLSEQKLKWLLSGVDVLKIKPHKEKNYCTVM